MSRRLLAVLALSLALLAPLRAQPAPTPSTAQAVVAAVQFDRLSGGAEGISGSVEWLQSKPGQVVSLGLSAFSVAGTTWGAGTVTASRRMSPRVFLDVRLAGGIGDRLGNTFFYRRAGTTLLVTTHQSRLLPELGVDYLALAPLDALILRPGITVHWSRRVSTKVVYGEGVAGSYQPRFANVGVGVLIGDLRWIGGATLGSVALERLLPQGPDPEATTQREWYTGLTVPVRGAELTIVLSRIDGNNAHRHSVAVASKVPIR